MINDFNRIFDRKLDDFKKYENKKEIVEVLFEAEKNLDEVVSLIKSDVLEDDYTIFTNLLSLYPFSAKIIEKLLNSGFIEQKDLVEKLDIVFEASSEMGNLITKLKKMVRNESIAFSNLNEKLNELNKELEKYQKEFEKKKELQEKINELNTLKNEVSDISELEEYEKKLQKSKATLESLKEEIKTSKKAFNSICKGDA